MSRVAKQPIAVPKGVDINVSAEEITVKGSKGTLSLSKPAGVDLKVENGEGQVSAATADLIAMATHGRTGFFHVVNGSLTEDIVNHTSFPVLSVKL